MMARGFRPVGWVAGVAAAALGCYMLSLNVASERAELAKLERSIITTKRDIRTLQTELGTRGRLQQLESWNANVLALSAPTSAQFLDSEVTLARFDQREPSIDERSVVHMASAPARPAPAVEQKVQAPVRYASAPAAEKPARSLVHQASLVVDQQAPAPAPTRVTAPVPAAAKAAAPVKVASAEKKVEKKVAETPAKPPKEATKTPAKAAVADKVEKKAEPVKRAEPAKKAEPVKKAEAPAKKTAPAADKLAKETRAPKPAKSGNAVGQ